MRLGRGGVVGGAMILGGLSYSYGQMLASRLLLGAAESILWPVSNKLVLDWFPFRERGRAQAGLAIGPPIGPAIGVPIILAILVSWGWRASFFVVGVLSWVVVLPLFWFLVRDDPQKHPWVGAQERELLRQARVERQRQAELVQSATTREMFRNWRYWLTVVGNAANNSVVFGLGFWIPTFLRARHLSVAAMGGWTSFAWAMAAAFIVVIGLLIDWSHRPALLGAVDCLLALVFLLVAANTSNVGLVGPMMGLAFGCAGGQNMVEISLVGRYSNSVGTGRAFGVGWGIGGTVAAVFPAFMGFLYGQAHGSFVPPLIAVMSCYGLSAVLLAILSVGERRVAQVAVPAPSLVSERPS